MYSERRRVEFRRLESSSAPSARSLSTPVPKMRGGGESGEGWVGAWGVWQATRILIEGMISLAKTGREAGKGGGPGGGGFMAAFVLRKRC